MHICTHVRTHTRTHVHCGKCLHGGLADARRGHGRIPRFQGGLEFSISADAELSATVRPRPLPFLSLSLSLSLVVGLPVWAGLLCLHTLV
jgi:hypothetical protein